jgi:peroxiredoxin
MDQLGGDLLQRAEHLLREGKRQEARPLLIEFVQGNPASARGWWLLSMAVTDVRQQMDCVERVLKFEPQYAPAQARLEKLKSSLATGPSDAGIAASKPNPSIVPAEAMPRLPRPAHKPSAPSQKVDWVVLVASVSVFCICIVAGGISVLAYMPRQQAEAAPAQDFPSQPQSDATPIPSSKIGPDVGKYAPNFTLKNVSTGSGESLNAYRGRSVVILFWATWCGYCKQEMPSLQKIYEANRAAGLVVLAVDVGESASKARGYRDSQNLTFPVLNDSSEDVAQKYRVTGYPTNFFVDSTGRVFSIEVGMMDYASLETEVRALLGASR